MSTATDITMDPELAAQLGTPVLVDPALPQEPSDGEKARRFVRHLYAQAREDTGRAALFPDTLGDVGPRPSDPINAMWADGRLLVSPEGFEKLRDLGRRRLERERSRRARERQEQHDLQTIATALGVRKVTALVEPDYQRTLYRAHLEPEGTVWRGGPQVRIEHSTLARKRDTNAVIIYIAHQLRTAIAEWKLDEEEAGRGR